MSTATAIGPGIYDDLPYVSDPSALSVSGAKDLLLKSAAKFQYLREHRQHSDAFDIGKVFHELVLKKGSGVAVIPATGRTKAEQEAHKEAKETARVEGLVPITRADYDRAKEMADAVMAHPGAARLLRDGRPEVAAYAVDEHTGVMRRGWADWVTPTGIVDLKSSVSAHPGGFGRTAANFGYHMQAAWYLDLFRDNGHPADYFAFVVCEKDPPYLVSVIQLDDESVQRGRDLNRQALEMFRDCTASGIWPGYHPGELFTTVSLPGWAFREDS